MHKPCAAQGWNGKSQKLSVDPPTKQGYGATCVEFQDQEAENKLCFCPRRKAAECSRDNFVPLCCHVDRTGAPASRLFLSNWLREGLQEKEIPVLIFLRGCSLKRCVCILICILMNARNCFNSTLQKIKRECLKGIMWAWQDCILIKLIPLMKEACKSVHLDKSSLTLWEPALILSYAFG